MSQFEQWFEQKLCNPANAQLLGALQLIINAQSENLWRLGSVGTRQPGQSLVRSAQESPGISINRTPGQILGKYGIAEAMLSDHIGSGTVIDIGAGESSLLDAFPRARTIAVDAAEQHIEFQQNKGHKTVHANAVDLHDIPSETADLVVAHMSAPFWLDTLEEAQQAEAEMRRITKVGGFILVGSLATPASHEYYESILFRLQENLPVLPWNPDEEFAIDTCVPMFFAKQLFPGNSQPDSPNGTAQIVGNRARRDRGIDLDGDWDELHVPNFLIVRKI